MKERKWGGLEKCKEWIEMLREMEIKKEEDTAKKLAQKPDDGHMNPLVLLTAMDEVFYFIKFLPMRISNFTSKPVLRISILLVQVLVHFLDVLLFDLISACARSYYHHWRRTSKIEIKNLSR